MNWKTIAFAAAMAGGLAATAQADEVTGKITAMDTAALTLTLDDGNTYDFSTAECRADATCALKGVEVGDDVMIVWVMEQDKRMAQAISPQN